jgi:hypothetical protein
MPVLKHRRVVKLWKLNLVHVRLYTSETQMLEADVVFPRLPRSEDAVECSRGREDSRAWARMQALWG